MGKRAPKNEEIQEAKGRVVEDLEETTVVEDVQLIHKHYLKGGTTDGCHIRHDYELSTIYPSITIDHRICM